MNSCPNINLPEYKLLEKHLGVDKTYAIFMANGEVLPTMEVAEAIVYKFEKEKKELITEEQKIIDEILTVDPIIITEIVEDFSNLLKSKSKKIEKSSSFEQIKNLVSNEEGLSKWGTLNSLLANAKNLDTNTQDVDKNTERILTKARAIGIGIFQTNNIIDLIFEDVKNITKDKTTALENIHNISQHLIVLNDFSIFLEEARKTFEGNKEIIAKINDGLGKIQRTKDYIVENDKSGIIEAFKPFMSNIDEYLKWFKEEAARMRNLQNKTKSLENKEKYKLQAEALEEHIEKWDLTQDNNILDFLIGKRGDANLANTLLEAYSDSTDPIIASFTSWLQKNLHSVKVDNQKFEKEYETELKPIYNILGKRFNPEDLGKQITNESERMDSAGNTKKVIELLNEYSGTESFRGEERSYKYIEQSFKNEEKALEELIRNGEEVEKNKELLQEKRKEIALWKRDFMQQEYNSDYYKKYDLYEDEIGQKLKEEVEEIFSNINSLKLPIMLKNEEIDPITESAIDSYYKEYILLGNVNYLDGSPKTGVDLQKALKMQEIRALNREIYEYIPNLALFQKSKLKYSESIVTPTIVENSLEYNKLMEDWENENNVEVIKQEFYEYRSALYEELSYLTENSPDFTKEIEKEFGSFDSNWEIINGLQYGHRDDENQVIGTEIQKKGIDRIKKAFENLETLQKILKRASGLTSKEFEEYQSLFLKKDKLDRNEIERFNVLNSKRKIKDVRSKRISEIFNEIRELQSRLPTDYYVSTFNDLSQKYNISIDKKGNVIGKSIDIFESSELNILLKKEDFKKWFTENHIKTEVWDDTQKELVEKYKRLPHWNKIKPTNPNYIEKKPSRKYSIRQVKPEYRTGYDKTTEEINLVEWEHVDNKGHFLPKKGKFQSKEYESLKNAKNNEQKALFDLLKTHTKYTLKAQEDISFKNKLGLDIPRYTKSSTERNMRLLKTMLDKPSAIPSVIWNRIMSKWKNDENYSIGEGNFQAVFADKYGNEYASVPVRGTGKLNVDEVSLDVFSANAKYAASLKLNKKLIEISPVQQALQRVLGSSDTQPMELTKKIKGSIRTKYEEKKANKIKKELEEGKTISVENTEFLKYYKEKEKSPKSKENTRQFAVERIVRRVFQGQEKKMELGRYAEKFINILKGLTVLKSIAFDIPASLANVINAEREMLVNMSNGYITKEDFGKAHIIFVKDYLPAFIKDYSRNNVGEESLQSQIFDLFQFVQSESYEGVLGSKISNSKIKDALALNWIKNHRQWGEVFVQTVNGLSYLNATKLEQTLSDGSKKTISLLDAYELDTNGHIKIKEGVPKEWDLKEFNTTRLKDKIQRTSRALSGNYAKDINKPEAETYTSYSAFFMMKRFFIPMVLNRFSASSFKKTANGIKFIPRYNQNTDQTEVGYYLETINLISKEIEAKIVTGEFEKMTQSETIAFYKTVSDISMMTLAYFLMTALFGWDDDDEDKYEKIKNNSWYTNLGLYQSARLLTESTTFINVKQYGDFIFGKPMIWGTLENLYDMLTFTIHPYDEDSYYKRSSGIYKKGDSKAKARLYKATGIEKIIKGYDDKNTQVQDFMKLRAR